MKHTAALAVLTLFFSPTLTGTPALCAAEAGDNSRDAATEQARQDYRVYLDQLKAISQQYREVTGEVKGIIQEEGYPVFDEDTGQIEIRKGGISEGKDAAVRRENGDMVVETEMPGLDRNSLNVRVDEGSRLVVTAKKKSSGEIVERVMNLPVPVLGSGHEARYEDGILTVKLKAAEGAPKEIDVPVT